MTTYPRTDPATGKPWPAYMGKKDFAQRVLTRSPSYVTQLGDAGRLVLHPNGKWVDVQASLDRIEATASPDKQPVAERHAAARALAAGQQPGPEDVPPPVGDALGQFYDFQTDRAKQQHFVAKKAEVEFLKEAKALCHVSEVDASYAEAGVAIRAAVEAWAADLPPMLAGQDEAFIRTTLSTETENLLSDLASRFRKTHSAQKTA